MDERELTMILAVCVSASQRFGTRQRTKRAAAAELAALLALCAVSNNDRVGLIVWSGLPGADIRIGDCSRVFKGISSIELYRGIEVLFRRVHPGGHLFLSVSGRAEMVV